jgi:hypothetical protein
VAIERCKRVMPDDVLPAARWKKSSYSGNTGNCVEVAMTDSLVGIRDSKNSQHTVLWVSRAEWEEFIAGVKGT